MILELAEDARRKVSSRLGQVMGKTERDGKQHDISLIFEGDFGISLHCVPPDEVDTLQPLLRRHGYGRFEKSDLKRWLGLGTVAGERGKVAAMALILDTSEAPTY